MINKIGETELNEKMVERTSNTHINIIINNNYNKYNICTIIDGALCVLCISMRVSAYVYNGLHKVSDTRLCTRVGGSWIKMNKIFLYYS